MAKGKYKQDLDLMMDQMAIELSRTPIQEVKPVETIAELEPGKVAEPEKKPEGQLNVWIPKDLLKKVKVHSAETDQSLKEITIKALEAYLR
jgi:predicted HicB family RNase H-like nuclease